MAHGPGHRASRSPGGFGALLGATPRVRCLPWASELCPDAALWGSAYICPQPAWAEAWQDLPSPPLPWELQAAHTCVHRPPAPVPLPRGGLGPELADFPPRVPVVTYP